MLFLAVLILLAVGDYEGVKLTLMIVSLISSMVSTVGVCWITIRTRRQDRKDDAQAKVVADMQLRLDAAGSDGKAMVEKLLEERLRAASHEVNNHVQSFVNGLELLKEKAAESAEEFKELNAADHENRLTIATQIGNLQKWMLEFFASKDDVRAIDQSVRTLEQKVAVVANQAERARRQ